ncbi:MAG TPA: hypothetical protein VI815_00030 [Candidatus Nanoarchaeia archaeon]|nr:hypothetical protein [Candidatus Nanoarchaeia archaeon]
MEIVITDEGILKAKIASFSKDGRNSIHVLTDFDKTLTKFVLPNGEEMPSLIFRIRNGFYLSKEYSQKANELYDYYHKIEIDDNLSIEQKKPLMHEWWFKHFKLLGESGLNKEVIDKVAEDLVDGQKIALRLGVREFFKVLNENNIPLIIISSSVGDLIESFLKKEGLLNKNVHIIANSLNYDYEGQFVRVEHIVHVFNKDETVLGDFPLVFDSVKERKNVILLGDSLGDLGMIHGFEYNELIKVAFLNENIKNNLEKYKEAFDVVITGDGDFSEVNKILREILD